MKQEDYMKELVKGIEKMRLWDRVISIDLETDCRSKNFLSNERILAIGAAYFNEDGSITTRDFILEKDTEQSEINLLQSFDKFLKSKSLLVVTGFNISLYDIPLLAIKNSHYRKQGIPTCWKIINLVENTLHVELSSQLQFFMKNRCNEKFQRWSLDKVVNHDCFKNLPLLRSKDIIPTNIEDKGEFIYNLWKESDPSFKEYLKGDVHDPLVLIREIFKD